MKRTYLAVAILGLLINVLWLFMGGKLFGMLASVANLTFCIVAIIYAVKRQKQKEANQHKDEGGK